MIYAVPIEQGSYIGLKEVYTPLTELLGYNARRAKYELEKPNENWTCCDLL